MAVRERKLHTLWTEHIKNPEVKADFEKLLRNSTISLGRLREIAEKQLASLRSAEVKVAVYDNPNWAYKQADTNGACRVLQNFIDLLDFTKKGK